MCHFAVGVTDCIHLKNIAPESTLKASERTLKHISHRMLLPVSALIPIPEIFNHIGFKEIAPFRLFGIPQATLDPVRQLPGPTGLADGQV